MTATGRARRTAEADALCTASYAVSAWITRSIPVTSCSSSIRKPIVRCTSQAIAPEARKA